MLHSSMHHSRIDPMHLYFTVPCITEFNLPNESHVRGDLISSLRRHYNIWHFHLHANYYLKWNTDAQRRANCPKETDPSHWNWIISYWGSARFKRTRLMRQIEQHNEKRATFADKKRENDDYSYDISLDEDFVTALEYGMPPASGKV
ncbi:hypothetical protein KSP39_PZI011628 [Platanthera zijinensis]|uniref:Uncharacterized protein n=1 Tax=Platanthera zijinensis TaxID=2320716 RepID=A0AAP0BIQ9_9ASPA